MHSIVLSLQPHVQRIDRIQRFWVTGPDYLSLEIDNSPGQLDGLSFTAPTFVDMGQIVLAIQGFDDLRPKFLFSSLKPLNSALQISYIFPSRTLPSSQLGKPSSIFVWANMIPDLPIVEKVKVSSAPVTGPICPATIIRIVI